MRQRSESAVLAWVFVVGFVVGFVVVYDLWAHFTGHPTMSAQFARWLHESVMGPIIIALYVGIPAGLFYHFIRTKIG